MNDVLGAVYPLTAASKVAGGIKFTDKNKNNIYWRWECGRTQYREKCTYTNIRHL